MMPGFDESKDKVLAGPQVAETDEACFELKVVSYNGGDAKLQISRFQERGEDRQYQKLGRVTRDEWEAIRSVADELWGKAGS